MTRIFYSLLTVIVLSGLAVMYSDIDLPFIGDDSEPKIHTVIPIDSNHKPGQFSYINDVKPILDARCAGCHSGYDAPCQLKLTSFEGLARGATKKRVVDRYRFSDAGPTRLFIDETTTAAWRKQGFFSVLNEKAQFPEINLNHSLLAKLLTLKHNKPLSPVGKLPDAIAADVQGAPDCPTLDEIADYQKAHPLSGMPYALPPLTKPEQSIVLNWLQDGAKAGSQPALPALAVAETRKWEQFFNDSSLKNRLLARYLYEHLYSGDLHFKDHPADEFYQLVRSKTPSGQAVEELKTVRPFDEAGVKTFYYRLRPVVETIVDKNHVAYELSDGKMERFNELFLKPGYTVTQLPAYGSDAAAHPFKTFNELPVASRYRFLLDDAGYFIAIALKSPAFINNSIPIQDQFWIAFIKPQPEFDQQNAHFLAENSEALQWTGPEGEGDGFLQWRKLRERQQRYLDNKHKFSAEVLLNQQAVDLNLLWNGDGNNDNALLSVFRHDDNASVTKGLLGKTPLTAWVLDYPLFERMHYLLVAGFNTYGSMQHRITTRGAMDALRREAENNFLQFMPKTARQALYDSWYQGMDSKVLNRFDAPDLGIGKESAISYQTGDYKTEFFEKIQQYAVAAVKPDTLNRCRQDSCSSADSTPEQQYIDSFMRKLADMNGDEIKALPEVSFLRIKTADPAKDPVYTLIRNRERRSLSMFVAENLLREPQQDSLTVTSGCLGSYPNMFFDVPLQQLENFIEQLKYAQADTEIDSFYSRYGVRRNNPEIWAYYDWVNQKHRVEQAGNAGLFDMSRYENL